jgi:hypothetical protein
MNAESYHDALSQILQLPLSDQRQMIQDLSAAVAAANTPRPVSSTAALAASFWPMDESTDDFVNTLRELRNQSEVRMID